VGITHGEYTTSKPTKTQTGAERNCCCVIDSKGTKCIFWYSLGLFHKAAGGLCDVSSYSSNEVDGVLQVDVQGLICIDALD